MTKPPESTRVVFFQVRDVPSKLKRIYETAALHFEKKEHFVFFVEDEKSAIFVDELLWKSPPTSFLPHTITDFPSTEWLSITKTKTNVNQAKIAFNLCATPLLIEGDFRIIYEFEDHSSPNKNKFSSLRLDAYKNARFSIEARV